MSDLRQSVSVSSLLLSTTRPTVSACLWGEWGIRAGSRNICTHRRWRSSIRLRAALLDAVLVEVELSPLPLWCARPCVCRSPPPSDTCRPSAGRTAVGGGRAGNVVTSESIQEQSLATTLGTKQLMYWMELPTKDWTDLTLSLCSEALTRCTSWILLDKWSDNLVVDFLLYLKMFLKMCHKNETNYSIHVLIP